MNYRHFYIYYFTFYIFLNYMAERAGFEPAIPFWSIHAFQACALSRSATSPTCFG